MTTTPSPSCCFYKGSHVGDGYAVTACFSNQGSVGLRRSPEVVRE